MKNITLYIILVLLLNSCVLIDQEDIHISRGSAGEFKEILVDNRTVQFSIGVVTPTPCYGFYSSKSEKIDHTFQTTIFIKTSSQPCFDMIGSIEVELKITVPDPGEYTFSFWQYDDEYLETTLVFQ